MGNLKDSLPFKPTLLGAALFIVAVAAGVYVARKVPVLNKLT